jgi:dipeptidyl aminopeptidase/acylaminoacyl peptidase
MRAAIRKIGIALAILGVMLVPTLPAAAAPQAKTSPAVEQAIHDMFAVHQYSQAAISPDGSRVAWVESLNAKNGAPSPNSAIYVADWETGGARVHITAAKAGAVAAENDVVWSPGGRRLAFLSDAGHPGQSQLYVVSPGGPVRQLTHLKGALSDISWSPDGGTIALLFIENAPPTVGPLAAVPRQTGVIGSKIYEKRIALVNVATGEARQISPADLYVYEYDWAPDGKHLTGTAAHGDGDDNWWVNRLYVFDATTGKAHIIYTPPVTLQVAYPRWSPDGRSVAFIGGLMSDQGVVGGDIYTVSASGGEARDVTEGMKASASSLTWSHDSKSIVFGEIVDGECGVASLDLASGRISTLWQGPDMLGSDFFGVGLSLSRDGKESATVRQSFTMPPEVWAGPVGKWKQVTSLNKDLKPSWGKAESLHWNTDIGTVQGWLVYPRNYDPARHYPMVVDVHGGPAWANLPRWPSRWSYVMALPPAGYFVLLPNPRGSYGAGEAFTRANVKDFGGGDFRDIMAGVDQAIKTVPVDAEKLGITGWSYGGYMTMWAVTQTHRFHAAVAGAGLANWLSYYGQNKIDKWMIPFFGSSVYDDPAVYAKSGPIHFVKNVKTPTLIVVGERDAECPAPQSYEFWHALKTFGVPTELVVYPNEGHLFVNPAHNRDVILRSLGWFQSHLEGGKQ